MDNMIIQSCILTILISVNSASLFLTSFKDCSSKDIYSGLMDRKFNTVGSHLAYSWCNLPDPQKSWTACGREEPSWICNPDGVLTNSEVQELEVLLNTSAQESHCRCKKGCPDGVANPIMVYIVEYLKIVNEDHYVCRGGGGGCQELFPQLNTSLRSPNNNEWKRTKIGFEHYKNRFQQHSSCYDGVTIIYANSQDKKLFSVAGGKAEMVLGSILYDAISEGQELITNGQIKEGLETTISRYAAKFRYRNRTPLIVGIVLASICGLFTIFGVVSIIMFCVYELRQGRTFSQVLAGCAGNYSSFLWSGNIWRGKPKEHQPVSTEPENV